MPDEDYFVTQTQLAACKRIIDQLFDREHKHMAQPFYKPVDRIEDGALDYYDVIKKPMDMGTVRKKLQRNKYRNADAFHADMKLMFRNCYLYNPRRHPVAKKCERLEQLFDSLYERVATITAEADLDEDDECWICEPFENGCGVVLKRII